MTVDVCPSEAGSPWDPGDCSVEDQQPQQVFVFGPRDDMSDVIVGDQPPAPSPEDDGPHHHQPHRHHMSPILVAPARGQTSQGEFDFVVTAPTPPITSSSGSSSATSRTPDDILGTTTSGSGFETSTTLRTANGTLRRAASDRPQYLSPSRSRREPRHKTISDVTAEARKVLEQLILRHDADADLASGSALLPLSAGAAVRSRVLPATSGDAGATETTSGEAGATGTTGTTGGEDEMDGRTQRQSGEHPAPHGAPLPAGPGTYQRADAVDIPDDDDATSHEPVSGPNSTYSFSSRSSSHRNRIHLMTQITDEAQLKRAAAQQQQRQKKKKKRKVRRIPSARRRGSTSSSSSSEYEIIDGQLRLRPKKSLFKRAKERLRQSFRRKKEPFDPYSIDDEELRQAEAQTPRTGNGATKRPFRLNFRQQSGTQTLATDRSPNVGDRGFHSDAAASMHNGRSYCPVHDVTQNGSAHRDAAASPGEKDKNRSFLDNILRTLRRGGERLRRRASHRETSTTAPPRSRSADAFTVHSLRRDADPRHQHRANNNRKSAPQEAGTSTRGGAGLIYCRCQSLDSHVTRPRPPPLPALGPTPDDDVDFVPGDAMGHTSLTDRQTLRLQGIDVNAPRQGTSGGRDGTSDTLLLDGGERHLAEMDELDGVDQVDSKSPVLDGPVVHTPFDKKTDQEKDELFEKIAEQLAAIADNYNLESPRSMKNADLFFKPPTTTPTRTSSTSVPKSASAPLPAPTSPAQPALRTSLTVPVPAAGGGEGGAEGGARGGGHTPIEQKIGRLLRDKGDKAAAKDLSDFQPVVSEMVRNASYSRFQQIIHENVGSEPGWQQVALVFNLTRSAVQLAGLGTAAALQIKELTLRYFEDRFAGWIVGQGGWESMVEDTDLSSEVD